MKRDINSGIRNNTERLGNLYNQAENNHYDVRDAFDKISDETRAAKQGLTNIKRKTNPSFTNLGTSNVILPVSKGF